MAAQPQRPCIFFLQNRCRKGADCEYAHGTPKGTVERDRRRPTTSQSSVTSTVPPRKQAVREGNNAASDGLLIPCRFFQNGFCSRGTSCFYAHVTPSETPVPTETTKTIRSSAVEVKPDVTVEKKDVSAM